MEYLSTDGSVCVTVTDASRNAGMDWRRSINMHARVNERGVDVAGLVGPQGTGQLQQHPRIAHQMLYLRDLADDFAGCCHDSTAVLVELSYTGL